MSNRLDQSPPHIPDITDAEQWVIRTTLRERYGRDIPLEQADAEIRLNPADRTLSLCPVIYWEWEGCHFVLFKTGECRYRCQFYYRLHRQISTGIPEYDQIAECVVSLLQAQADYLAQERGDLPVKRLWSSGE
ncbi:conserved hypothetical protein [Gammaproteobacteria bacterium]